MKQSKFQSGFTIIEVLIVLAIAGLILLIVFVAVPAAKRNQRNMARKTEAGLIASAVRECLGNKQQVLTECDTMNELQITASQFAYTDDVVVCGSGGTVAETRCSDTYTHPSGAYPAILLLSSYDNNTSWSISSPIPTMVVEYGKVCQNNVLHPTASGGKNDVVVTVTLEGARVPQTICYTT